MEAVPHVGRPPRQGRVAELGPVLVSLSADRALDFVHERRDHQRRSDLRAHGRRSDLGRRLAPIETEESWRHAMKIARLVIALGTLFALTSLGGLAIVGAPF